MGNRHARSGWSTSLRRVVTSVVLVLALFLGVMSSAQTVADAATMQAVYRLDRIASGDVFLTSSAAERSAALSGGLYADRGVAFSVATSDPDNNAPVYRLYSPVTGNHFFTISAAERDASIAGPHRYVYEGVAFMASAMPNAQPVYRLVNLRTGAHAFTASAAEKDGLAGTGVWYFEGVAFYLASHEPVTLSFDSSGGSAITPITGEYGSALSAPVAPVKTGSTFAGWYREVSLATPFVFTAFPAQSLTVYAKWAVNSYTMSFNSNGGSPVSAVTAAYGTSIAKPADPRRTGYTFSGWYSDSGLTSVVSWPVSMGAGNTTLYAKWTVNQYSIGFNSNGGSAVSAITRDYGSSAAKPIDPTRTGYTFGGWYSDSGLTSAVSWPVTVGASNVTYYAKWTINSYTLSYSAGTGGTISGAAKQTVNYGGSGTAVTAVPAAGYRFASWSDGVATATRTDSDVSASKSVTANFQKTYTLNYAAGANGSIAGTSPQTVDAGASGTAVAAIPAAHYHFVQWSDGVKTATRTDSNVQADVSVTAQFAIDTFTLGYSAGTGGSVLGTSPQTVEYGADGTKVIAWANAGYRFAGWSDGVQTGDRTDTNVTADKSVTANFQKTYTLTYLNDGNGTVSGTNVQTVESGADGTSVTAVPKTGYNFARWSDDVMTATRTDTNVVADKTVSAYFSIQWFSLNYGHYAHGTITGEVPQIVSYGSDATAITAVPDEGYHFVEWDDGYVGNPRQDTYVTKDVVANAKFAINTYTLNYSAGTGGSVQGLATQSVDHGSNGSTVTAVAGTGYHFTGWSDGVQTASRTDTGIQADKSVTANFEVNQYWLDYYVSGHGGIKLEGMLYPGGLSLNVNHGMDGATVTAIADTGYHFTGWSDGVATAGRTDTGVTGPISVTASFAINTYTLSYSAGAHGSIEGSATQTVDHGSSGTAVTAVAGTGYHFVKWSDGSTENPRTDTNVSGDKNLTASFAENVYDIVYRAAANGSVLHNGTSWDTGFQTFIGHGKPVTAEAVPDIGYHFTSWSDGILTASRTDTITAPVDVTASFAVNNYLLSYSAGSGGSITGTTGQWVQHGLSGSTVTAVPSTGYHFVSWSDGVTTVSRRDINVTADLTVSATFAINTYVLDYSAGDGGSISGTTPQTVDQGEDGTAVTAVADTGYSFVGWSDGVKTAERTDLAITADLSVSASFAPNTYTLTLMDGETVLSTVDYLYGTTVGVPEAPPAKDYEQFVHWYVSDPDVAYDGSATMGVGGITLHARYDATYIVTFRDGKRTISEDTVTVGSHLTAPEEHTKRGYRLLGWYRDPALTRPWYFETAVMPDNDIILYAKYVQQFTLTYSAIANGGVSSYGPNPATVDAGGNGPLIVAYPLVGYHFVSWSDGVLTAERQDTNVQADITVSASFAIDTLTLTYSAGAGGSVEGSATQTVEYGASGSSVTAKPSAGYHFVDWSDGVQTATRTDIGVVADNSVTANFAINTYLLGYSADAGGSLSGMNPQSVEHGKSGTAVTAVPDTGYHFVSWSDGVSNATRIDTNVTGDVLATATFAKNVYWCTYRPGSNGVIQLGGTTVYRVAFQLSALHGGDVTTVIGIPDQGYHFVSWSDGVMTALRTDTNITGSIDVTAEFAINTYTLTYSAGTGGTIEGSGSQSVDHGSSGTAVTAVPATGYHFTGWSDGSTANPRTDTGVTSDMDLTANFAINNYYCVYRSDADGRLLFDGRYYDVSFGTSAEYGGTLEVTAVPKTGYHFTGWSDGVTSATRTDSDISAAIDVTASYAIDTYTLSYSAGAGGTVEGPSPQTVNHGYTGSAVKAVPGTGYHFVQWSDGVTSARRTDASVTADIDVEAIFAINTYALSYSAGTGGSIDGAATQEVDHGSDGSPVMAVPEVGYHFVKWSDGSTTNPRTDTAVAGDVTVSAEFAVDTFTLSYSAGTNGSLEGSATQIVAYGDSGTAVAAVPATGYHFSQWSDGGTDNPRTDSNVVADKNVMAQFERTWYYVQYDQNMDRGGYFIAPGFIADYKFLSGSFPIYEGDDCYEITAYPYPGYEFVSWSDGSTNPTRHDKNVTEAMHLTANFKVVELSVKYAAGEGGSLSGETSQTVAYGGSATSVAAVPAEGYHFTSWSDGSTSNPRTDTGVTVDLAVWAGFARNQYNVGYGTATYGGRVQAPWGTGLGVSTPVYHGDDGYTVTAVPDTGYEFEKWDDGNTNASRFEPNVTGDLYFSAYFKLKSYSVTYVAGNGGTISGETSQTVQYDGTSTPVYAQADPGYTFTGWSDGIDTASRADGHVTADKTITANFAPIEYDLVLMDGETETYRGSLAYGTAIKIPPAATAAEGYLFEYWYADDPGVAFESGTTMPIGGLTLHAKYTEAYTVFFMDGADVFSSEVVAVGGSVTSPDSTKVGYAFIGWYRDASFRRAYNFSTSVMPANDIKIYGKWESSSVTVTFDAGLGTVNASQVTSGTPGSDITLLDPTKPAGSLGFEGWYDDTTSWGTKRPLSSTYTLPLSGSPTLYARYNYFLYYHDVGGKLLGGWVEAEGHTSWALWLPAPTWDDTQGRWEISFYGVEASLAGPKTQIWDGWYDAPTGGSKLTTMPSGDTDVYARWKATVTFDGNGTTGGTVPSSQVVLKGQLVSEPTQSLTKDGGYTFAGWSTVKDDASTWWDFTESVVTDDTTLYALWSAPQYALNFVVQGSGSYQQYFELGAPIVTDYTFVDARFQYWYYADDPLKRDISTFDARTMTSAGATVYAKFSDESTWTFYDQEGLNILFMVYGRPGEDMTPKVLAEVAALPSPLTNNVQWLACLDAQITTPMRYFVFADGVYEPAGGNLWFVP